MSDIIAGNRRYTKSGEGPWVESGPLHWSDRSRGTGRTTRMMERAVQAALVGKKVTIVFATKPQCAEWEKKVNFDKRMTFHTLGSVGDTLDWHHERIRGLDDIVLIDHFAVESHFRHIFDLAHRYGI